MKKGMKLLSLMLALSLLFALAACGTKLAQGMNPLPKPRRVHRLSRRMLRSTWRH